MKVIKGRHIVVLGGARSGTAAAVMLRRKGAFPFVSDAGKISEDNIEKLNTAGIPFEQNGHTERARKGEFLVISPGIPDHAPVARHYRESNRNIYSELEVASWFNSSPITAVTGTNGKTTVANWLAHTWKVAGRSYLLAGNIGSAFSDHVDKTSADRDALLEVSSFQLDHIDTFHPNVGLILNITED
ncbi:MAG: Mur ligase family protein, partial [Balneolaceae bacterium]|nr:Mur ligase family protein [Balneolaceae bacterium]